MLVFSFFFHFPPEFTETGAMVSAVSSGTDLTRDRPFISRYTHAHTDIHIHTYIQAYKYIHTPALLLLLLLFYDMACFKNWPSSMVCMCLLPVAEAAEG